MKKYLNIKFVSDQQITPVVSNANFFEDCLRMPFHFHSVSAYGSVSAYKRAIDV